MRKTTYLIMACCSVVFLLIISSCKNSSSTQTDNAPNATSLKDRINAAQEKNYHDKTYNVTVPYLDCFDADTAEAGTARFEYRYDEKTHIRLVMFVEPNIEGWNIKDAVSNLAVGSERCLKETDNFFIMTGEMSDGAGYSFMEKCFLVADNWIDLAMYYPTNKENDVERFIEIVKNWNP